MLLLGGNLFKKAKMAAPISKENSIKTISGFG